MEVNQITETIFGCAIKVHRALGPGLLESTYAACVCYELIEAGLNVKQQVPLPLIYKEIHMEIGYRLDLLVESVVVVKIKSVEVFDGSMTISIAKKPSEMLSNTVCTMLMVEDV